MRTLLIDDMRKMKVSVIARSFEAGLRALKAEKFDILYLDHDLGDPDPRKTGYDILNWLENHPEYLPGKIVLVTANPVGRQKMDVLIKRLYPNNVMPTIEADVMDHLAGCKETNS